MSDDSPGRGTRRLASQELASTTIAELKAMDHQQIARLMGATVDEVAAEPREWREAAIAATDEFADQLDEDIDAGRARVTMPGEPLRVRPHEPFGQQPDAEDRNAGDGRVFDPLRLNKNA